MSSADTTGYAFAKIGPGRLVLVVGPSGAGKDTLLAFARDKLAGDSAIVFPRRTVTRPSSESEDNEAIAPEDFERAVIAGRFALWWRAHGHGYGIDRSIDDHLANGRTVVINVSRTITPSARTKYQDVVVVLITAPPDILATRLESRARRSDGTIAARLQREDKIATANPDVTIHNIGSSERHGCELVQAIIS